MATKLTLVAIEKSTYAITFVFNDDESNPVTPNIASWSLYDRAGNVMNSRDDVSISVSGSQYTITLKGDDLVIANGVSGKRIFKTKGTYDSLLGNDLPVEGEATFNIEKEAQGK